MKVIKYGMTEVEYACQVEKSDGSRQEKVIIHQDNPSADMINQGKDKSIASRKKLVLNIQGYSENMTGNIIGSCRSWIRGIQVIMEC
jgi:hypothetical protein